MAEQDMTLSVNGQSQVPPGFRFHPTEEELLHYYLRKKVAYQKIDLDVIRDVDLNKLEPWDIQEKCKIGSTPQNDWYFFSHKDKKYPTGTRTNRATAAGFWKATGRDKIIYSGPKRIGLRKTLVFYKGRAPHGQKSDWIMHEYRLDDSDRDNNAICNSIGDSQLLEDGWVVCRVFKKKNYQKSHDSPKNSPTSMDSDTHMLSSRNDGVLDQILQYMGRTCKLETESFTNISNNLRFLSPNSKNNSIEDEEEEQQVIIHHDKSFMHLPRLDSPPTLPPLPLHHETPPNFYHSLHEMMQADTDPSPTTEDHGTVVKLNNWVAFDRLVASQLNGHEEISSKQLSDESNRQDVTFCRLDNDDDPLQLSELRSSRSLMYGNDDNDIWGFTKSSSPSSLDPLSHLSV